MLLVERQIFCWTRWNWYKIYNCTEFIVYVQFSMYILVNVILTFCSIRKGFCFWNCPKMIYLALANFYVANFEIGSVVLWFAFLYCQNRLNYDRIISWLIFSSFFFRVLRLSQCSLTFHNFWVINQDKECKKYCKSSNPSFSL